MVWPMMTVIQFIVTFILVMIINHDVSTELHLPSSGDCLNDTKFCIIQTVT